MSRLARRNVQLAGLAVLGCAFLAIAVVVSRLRQERVGGLPFSPTPSSSESGDLPVLWQAPAFSLPNQRGETTKNAELAGKIWIADFIFTQCTTVCPRITAKMALLQRRIPSERLRFVSFSVDPEHDTEAALAEYARSWRPAEKRWLLLRTNDKALDELVKGMRVALEKTEDEVNPIVHTSMFFLVDERGAVRGAYDSSDDGRLETLVRDVNRLLGTEAKGVERSEQPSGEALYMTLGCGACHTREKLAPPLEGLVGRGVSLEDGGTVTADTAYIKESIVSPEAKIVRGYLELMPSYRGQLSEGELDALVGYVSALSAKPDAKAQPAATLALDPVCGMQVRVGKETPSAEHQGHAYHFCSESCRASFVAHPDRYLDAGKP